MAGTAYIVKTSDGVSQINYSDGSVQTGTEDELRATLASNLPDYEIKVVNRDYSSEENISKHQAKYDEIGDYADKQMQKYSIFSPSSALQVQDEYSQYVGQREGRVVDGIEIPKWVDNDYLSSYVSSVKRGNPRKPNNREMTELIAGIPVEQLYGTMDVSQWSRYTRQSSQLLYGVVGSNEDTRNWESIMASDNPVIAAQIATSQMYGGTTVSYQSGGYRTDANGNTVIGANGEPEKLPPALYIVGGNGTVLTSLSPNANKMATMLQNFGVRNTSWIETVSQAMPSDVLSQYKSVFNTVSSSYNPWTGFDSMWDMEFTSGVAPFINPFEIVSGLGQSEATGDTTGDTAENNNLGVTEQTIKTADSETTQETTQPVYETNQASESLPSDQTQTDSPVTTYDTSNLGGTGTNTYEQAGITGTFQQPVQTAGLSSVPNQVTVKNNYTGTDMANLTSQSQAGFGGQAQYTNQFGQSVTVTEDASGKPLTYVPPGFSKAAAQGGVIAMAEGGDVQLARKFLGFQGPADQLTNFLSANPAAAARMGKYQQAMSGMARVRPGAQEGTAGLSLEDFQKMQQNLVTQTMQPTQGAVSQIQPQAADFIAQDAGQVYDVANMANAATVGTVSQVGMPVVSQTSTMTPETIAADVKQETAGVTAQTGTPTQQVTGQTQDSTMVSGLQGQTGQSIDVAGAPTRTLQTGPQGELIQGTGVNQAQVDAAFGTGEVAAASVQDELAGLMQQFEGGDTPAWAAGSMRKATQMLSARGLGASSLAGQAVIQAAMEAALPIAQIDAGNKQQMALFKAEQRSKFLGMEFDQAFQAKVMNAAKVSEIANMNFTAEQQVALENSRAANTMELTNLSNKQAVLMAEAAALSQLDIANLNNRQQAAVVNAQNFLQMDMANLSNEQQTELFKSQQNIQALLTDQAAENAAAQFNATSENQTDQFFANLTANVGQFNASQANAMDQFNVNTVNALRQFNAEVQNQRDMFNAQNGLVVAQANAQWRQNIATLNNAAQNESNMDFAKTINALTSKNLDEIWQRERDNMSFAFTSSESAMDRALQIVLADKELESVRTQLAAEEDAASTSLMFRFLFGTSNKGLLGGIV